MSESSHDTLRRIYTGDDGFINETRLLNRIAQNIFDHSTYPHLFHAGITALAGLASIGLMGWRIGFYQTTSTEIVMRSLTTIGWWTATTVCARIHFRKMHRLEREILTDSYYLVEQAHQNQRPHEKYDPGNAYQQAVQFLYDHPDISHRLFCKLEKRAAGMAADHKARIHQERIHKSMDDARKILRLTVKRTVRIHGTPEQKSVVNSAANHRAMLIELARDHNGLSGVNLLRYVTGWNRVR